jgi:hypothetical protein
VRSSLFVVLVLIAVACRPKLDDGRETLKIPSALPGFAAEPIAASVVIRATELANEATVSLARHDLQKAIPLLTEALTVDGSHENARWLLAQTFLAEGRGSVALQLIAPLKEHVKDCGWCLEFLQKLKSDKAFERLVQSAEGHALLADLPAEPLPYPRWAKTLAGQIQSGKLEEIAKYAHPRLPFDMIRACPDCEDPAKRLPQHRQLLGAQLLMKVASRFDLVRPESAGIPLIVQGGPKCTARCCTWQTPKSLAPATAALERICLRPTLPDQPTVTEIALLFGTTVPRAVKP